MASPSARGGGLEESRASGMTARGEAQYVLSPRLWTQVAGGLCVNTTAIPIVCRTLYAAYQKYKASLPTGRCEGCGVNKLLNEYSKNQAERAERRADGRAGNRAVLCKECTDRAIVEREMAAGLSRCMECNQQFDRTGFSKSQRKRGAVLRMCLWCQGHGPLRGR